MNTHSSLMIITPRPDVVMSHGNGSWLWDESGKQYLDFIQGWAVNALGHCPPEVAQALTDQSVRLITPSPALDNRPQLEFASRLTALAHMSEVHFVNSGAEANEAAVKLARKWGRLNKGGAYKVISTKNAFHGRTLAMMAASGKPGWHELFPPYPDGFEQVEFGCVAAMESAIDETTVAIMVEPVQGEAGVVVPHSGYLKDLRALADRHGLLLIFDEIQTGYGRLGRMFAKEIEDVAPDIMTLGKGIGGGVPLGAVLAADRACCFDHGDQGGTYNGNPLMMAVGLAVTNVVSEPQFLANVDAQGAYLRSELHSMADRFAFQQVRGKGLLNAVVLDSARAEHIRDKCLELGLIVNAARPDVLRFMPSLRVTREEIDQCLDVLEQGLLAV